MAPGSFREPSEPPTGKGKMRRRLLIGGGAAAVAAALEATLHPVRDLFEMMRVGGERHIYQRIAGEFADVNKDQNERDVNLALYHAIGNAGLNGGHLDEILASGGRQAVLDYLHRDNKPYVALGIFPHKRKYYPTIEILVRAIATADKIKFAEEKNVEFNRSKAIRGALLGDNALVLITIPKGAYPTDLDQVSLFFMPQPAEYDEIAGTPRSGKSYVSIIKGSDLVRLADFGDLFSRNNPHDNADTRFARLTQTAVLNRYLTPIPQTR